MKRYWVYVILGILGLCCLSGAVSGYSADVVAPVASPSKAVKMKTDLVLIAVPFRAKGIMAGGTINALEKPASEMPPVWTSVLFRVERVVDGELKIPVNEEVSLWSQMKDAAGEKNFLKILAMDFEKPDEGGTDKGFLSMAVIDPVASFGIREGEPPAVRQRYRLSLARVSRDPDSYVLLKSEKM